MERHVEKVQTVGNLLDRRDNFIARLKISYWKIVAQFYVSVFIVK